jgi:hypothetical protein
MSLLIQSWCAAENPCGICFCPWKQYDDTVTFKFLTGYPDWDPAVTYAPGALVSYFQQPFLAVDPVLGVDPNTGGFTEWALQDTTDMPLDQTQLCAPYWGVAGIAVGSGHAPGDIVSGLIDVTLLGSWANLGSSTVPTSPPGLPPEVHVIYQGVNVFTFDPASVGATIIDFLATGDSIDPASGFVSGAFGPGVGQFQGNGAGGVPIYGGAWTALARLTIPGCVYLDSSNAHIIDSYNCVLPYTGPIPDPATVAQVTPSSDTSSTGPILFSDFYENTTGVWVPTGSSLNLAQTGSLLFLEYYLHAH